MPNGSPRKVGVGPGQDHAHAALGKVSCDFDDAHVEELRFVHGDHVNRVGIDDRAQDFFGAIDRCGVDGNAGVARDAKHSFVARVEMRLENVHAKLRDQRAAHATNELFTLAAEHHAGDDFDAPGTGVEGHVRFVKG